MTSLGYLLMCGSVGSTSHVFAHYNTEVDIYYLNLFKSQKVSNGSTLNGKIYMMLNLQTVVGPVLLHFIVVAVDQRQRRRPDRAEPRFRISADDHDHPDHGHGLHHVAR